MTDNAVLLEDEYLAAANELREITAQEKNLTARKDRCKEILAKVLAEGETGVDEDGQMLVKVKPGARVWNETAARENLPENLLAAITVTVTEERLDKDKAKAIFGDALYERCTKANKPSVVAL